MKPAAFDYVRPDTLDEVLETIGETGNDATLLAGGQSLVPMLALRLSRPGTLVDLNHVHALTGISTSRTHLRIGSMTRQATVLNDAQIAACLPVFQDVARYVGHYQTRSRGTVGGSLSLSDPAAEYPAFALAMDAEVELLSPSGTRRLPMQEFIVGPYMTALEADELMVAAHYPLPGPETLIGIDEIYRRPGDFALVGLVARLELDRGRISAARLAWLGVGSTAVRSLKTERALVGQALDDMDLKEIGSAAIGELELKSDLQATEDYRRSAGRNLAVRLLRTLRERVPA